MEIRETEKIIKVIIAVVVALLSIFVLGPFLGSVETYGDQISSIEAKRDTVVKLLTSSAGASAVITLIPDDVGTPVAEQLANLSWGFLIVLTVLQAEKYLLPILGILTCRILIPVICGVFTVSQFKRYNHFLRSLGYKLIALALACGTAIPASLFVSDMIENTFRYSIDQTVNQALASDEILEVSEDEEHNLWQKITGAVADAVSTAGRALEIAKKVLSNYVEAVSVMIVTSCLIPLLVIYLYFKIVKYVFRLNILKELDRSMKARVFRVSRRDK